MVVRVARVDESDENISSAPFIFLNIFYMCTLCVYRVTVRSSESDDRRIPKYGKH